MGKSHYREYLNEELTKRTKVNPRYSLRAFSESLDLDSGTLSQVLKGKRKLPKTHWLTITKKLKLSKKEKQYFLQSLWDEQGIDSKKTHFNTRVVNVLSSENYFEILSEWEFAAALCLFDIKHFRFSIENLSESLGISNKRANEIYTKLFQYGLVKFVNHKIIRSDKNFETTDDVISKALQVAHANELNHAIEKLQSLSVLEKEFTSLTFAGNAKDIKKMKLWIRSKREEFEATFENSKADQIFQFSVQLFPLSKKVIK